MGDQDQRQPELTAQPNEQPKHLILDDDIQRSGGLVGQQHLRVAGERHRDDGTLLHPAGKLVREALITVRRQTDEVEQLATPGHCLLPVGDVMKSQGFPDLPSDGLHGVESAHRTLEDHGDIGPAVAVDTGLTGTDDVRTVDAHFTTDGGGGRQQAHGGQNGGGLAATRLADQAHPLPGRHAQREVLHGVDGIGRTGLPRFEPHIEIDDLQGVLRTHSASFPRPTSGRIVHDFRER